MRKLNKHIKNLISSLQKEGISFYFDQLKQTKLTNYGVDDYVEKRLENVVFEKNGLKYKIYEGLFFRDLGQNKYFKKIKNSYSYVDLDDITFYEFQKVLILNFFKKTKS